MSFEWNRSINGAITDKALSCNDIEAALDPLPLTCVTLEDKIIVIALKNHCLSGFCVLLLLPLLKHILCMVGNKPQQVNKPPRL